MYSISVYAYEMGYSFGYFTLITESRCFFVIPGGQQPSHICQPRPGAVCCDDREASVGRACDAISKTLLRPIPVPAMNKWTKVFPTMGLTVLISQFYGIIPGAFSDLFGKETADLLSSESSSENEEDKALDAPINEAKKWRKLARKRNLRACRFLNDETSSWLNMLFVVLVEPVMTLHWQLFRHATWFSDRPVEASEDGLRPGQAKARVDAFCQPSKNPASLVILELMKLLQDPTHGLALMEPKNGPASAWSQVRKRTVRKAVLIVIGQLARKLVEPFTQFPWRLWPLASQTNQQEMQEAATQLLALPSCCCDDGLSGRLRRQFPSVEELLDPELGDFLRMLFERVVLTSTFIERRFSHMTSWTGERKGKQGCSPSLLAAKHINSLFKENAEAWRAKVDTVKRVASGQVEKERKRTNLSRPEWARKSAKMTVSRLNGYHVFVQEEKEAAGEALRGAEASTDFLKRCAHVWQHDMSTAQKAAYGVQAQQRNARTAALRAASETTAMFEKPISCEKGSWDLVPFDGQWPLDETFVSGILKENGFAALANSFKEDLAWVRFVRALMLGVADPWNTDPGKYVF